MKTTKYRIRQGSILEYAVFMAVVIVIVAACIWAGAGTYMGA